jgi:D-arginine dehydrogenase
LQHVEIIVIGAGIVGASVAYHTQRRLGDKRKVLVLEAESQPGYHATGRSAALYTESYGPPQVIALTSASRAFLQSPPAGFAEHALLSPRGSMYVAAPAESAKLHELFASFAHLLPDARLLSSVETLQQCPVLRPGKVTGAVLEPGAMDIDVHGLHQGFLRGLKQHGGEVATLAAVEKIERRAQSWRVLTAHDEWSASVLVNAAGAWCDEIARLAGESPIGLVPKRRTAIVFDAPPGTALASWPNVHTLDGALYFKPDAGKILASPADETPSPAVDAQAEEYDVALTAARIEEWTTLIVERIARKWAGLRSFVSDGIPVIGSDTRDGTPRFFWAAGLGGYGVQTSPAVGMLAADQILGGAPNDPVALDHAAYSPRRLSGRD